MALPFVIVNQPPVTTPAPLAGGWQVAQLDALGVPVPIDATIYATFAAAHARCMCNVLGLETAPIVAEAPPSAEPPPEPPPEPPA